MSNICIDNDIKDIPSIYKDVLMKKIEKVCQKTGFNDSDVKWIIFDPKTKAQNVIERLHVGSKGKDYGFCYIDEKVISISTLSIQKAIIPSIKKAAIYRGLPIFRYDDFLANVILDEITHIQTKCNHEDPIYDKKLFDNLALYYLSPIERGLLYNKF